jgi:hypothetical protein
MFGFFLSGRLHQWSHTKVYVFGRLCTTENARRRWTHDWVNNLVMESTGGVYHTRGRTGFQGWGRSGTIKNGTWYPRYPKSRIFCTSDRRDHTVALSRLIGQFPLISVLSCFHLHTAETWTSCHYPLSLAALSSCREVYVKNLYVQGLPVDTTCPSQLGR